LLSVLPHDRCGRREPNTDAAALVDKGTLGGDPPDDILGGQYPRHPATALRRSPARLKPLSTPAVRFLRRDIANQRLAGGGA